MRKNLSFSLALFMVAVIGLCHEPITAGLVPVSSYTYDNIPQLLNSAGRDSAFTVGTANLDGSIGGLTDGLGQAGVYVPATFFWEADPEQGTIYLNTDTEITANEPTPAITFDFGSTQSFSEVTIHYGVRTDSAVVAPEMVEVLVDNVSVGTFGGFDTAASVDNFGDIRSNTVNVGAQSGQNVTLNIIGGVSGLPAAAGTTWIGLTEVEFDTGCNPGDVDSDGDIDTVDLTTAISNFTGAGGSGQDCSTGDTDDDGDIDTVDLTFSISNFTGALAGDPNVPDLIYDPTSGNVSLDTEGQDVISFSLQGGPFNTGNTDFSGLPAGLSDNIANQIGWTSFNIGGGLVGSADLGAILPAGLSEAQFLAALAGGANYGLSVVTGGGGPLDLVYLPEPASLMLMGLGAMALVRRRRAA